MLYDVLCEKLDPRSGVIQEKAANDNEFWQTALDIVWKGNVHFVVVEALFRRNYGHYYVMRDDQNISHTYCFTRVDDPLFKIIQSMIDDIESGKFANKKTLSEKIRSVTEQKGLVSYMNNTKWRELFNAISEKMPEIKFQYKSVLEENAPDEFWEYYGDEDLPYMNSAQIEWLKIRHITADYKHIGVLLPPIIHTHDKKDEILRILQQYNINYEYNEDEQVFIVYGYK